MIKTLLLLLLLFSCGKKKSSEKRQNEFFDEDGIFYGRIQELNNSGAAGYIKIVKQGDSVEVKLRVDGLKSGTHEQYLHENSRCPISDLDSNGTIDVNEVSVQSGKRIIEFVEGTHESSYHLLLADLGREMMNFENRTLVVFQGIIPAGCAEIDRYVEEPPEPEAPRPTYTPRPRHEPEVRPLPPPPPPPEHTSWWSRLTERLRRWWCRVRGRCS